MKRISWVDGILAMGLLFLVLGVGMEYRSKVMPETEIELTRKEGEERLVVEVVGAVERPGVYEMKTGERIKDALIKAGGLSGEADRKWIEENLNQVEELWDGQKINVPKTTEVLGVTTDFQKINLNMASQTELEKLTGIGPAMASRIIEYRQENGGFRNVEEIKLVKGIGEKMYEKIKEEIKI
ncbi:ComEA family DNA-binding protein [Patescibacteria group bacterium]|nr:ComEA family DNA-binding protein [Patescibacteria group bacterium]